jgi:signal transduction histidine kinase
MQSRRHSLLGLMNIAAYLAWLAIGLEIWFSPPLGTGLLDASAVWPAAILLHAAFLLLFVAINLRNWKITHSRVLAALQVFIALTLIACARYSFAPVLLIIVMVENAQLYQPRALALVFATTNTALLLIFWSFWRPDSPLMLVLIYASFQLFAMLTSWYAITAERSRDEFCRVNADLMATRSLLTESVRDAERLRLSRELHDVVGHKLTALKLNLKALTQDLTGAALPPAQSCSQLADELLGDIRRVVQQLRLWDGFDLRQAVESMAAAFPRPTLHLQLTEDARIPDVARAEALLRSVQEALTNAARHSKAENIWVVLRREQEQLALDIRDDGRGAGPLNFGNGLTGMRERLQAVGGALQVTRNSTGGVQLLATVPVSP